MLFRRRHRWVVPADSLRSPKSGLSPETGVAQVTSEFGPDLGTGQGMAAAAEFQKIVSHPWLESGKGNPTWSDRFSEQAISE